MRQAGLVKSQFSVGLWRMYFITDPVYRVLNHTNSNDKAAIPRHACERRNTLQIHAARFVHPSCLIGALLTHISCRLLEEPTTEVASQKVALANVASDNHLFLSYDAQAALEGKSRLQLANIVDSCTYALKCAKTALGNSTLKGCKRFRSIARDPRLLCENAIANLLHILLCLQQAAIYALIVLSFNIVEAEIQRRRGYWEQLTRSENGRFSEWPSGQRPLSTSWPWNIRPSLVILWGVCWMFYDHGNPTHKRPDNGTEVPRSAPSFPVATPQPLQSLIPRKSPLRIAFDLCGLTEAD